MEESQINDRVKQIRIDKQKTQQEFAKELNITQGNLSLIESNKTLVTLQTIRLINKKYDIAYDWLIDGKQSLNHADFLTPLIDKAAMAGYPSKHGTDDFESSLEMYRIPGFEKGEHRIFEIEGDSMHPTLLPHEFVITAKIIDFKKIVNGSLCVVVTKKEIMAKRLYLTDEDTYRLESDNVNYEPIVYSEDNIQQIWGILAKITQSFYTPQSIDDAKVSALQGEMDQLKRDIEKIKSSLGKK